MKPGDRPIRMLYFVRETFPTFRVDVDVLFGRELVGRGHEIDFVMQAESEKELLGRQSWRGRWVWVGATDTRDRPWYRLRKHLLGFRHDLQALRLAVPAQYDAIQVRDKFLIAAIALVVARRRGMKFFFWLSWPEPESQLLRARERTARYPIVALVRGLVCGWLLYKWILPRCDHAFVQSQQMKKDVCAHGIDSSKLTPVPMGVASAEIPAAAPHGIAARQSANELTLAYLGTLNAQRRPEVLVEMLAILSARGIPARLLLVGDGDEPDDRQKIQRRADQLAVAGRMEITGFLPRADALERVRRADICISPFFPTPVLLSTSPTKLVEYLALGVPVVANDHPEQRLILHESRAGVCVPWHPRHFARAVVWLAKLGADRRREMGESGRRWVLGHRTYDRIADEVESTYQAQLLPQIAQAR